MRTCIYHRDPDGQCSAAIAALTWPIDHFVGIQYGEKIPWGFIDGNDVVLLDFSFQPWAEMKRLFAIAASVLWIDHHATAITEMLEHIARIGVNTTPLARGVWFVDHNVEAVLRDGEAACEITWKHLMGAKPMPELVRHIGRYDVWDRSDPTTDLVRHGLQVRDTNPKCSWWVDALDNPCSHIGDIVSDGRVIQKMSRISNKHACRSVRFVSAPFLEGVKVAVLNGHGNSIVFEDGLMNESWDVGAIFRWTGDVWKIGMYANKNSKIGSLLDLGSWCKTHGGGGHRGAAGFQCHTLPEWCTGQEPKFGVSGMVRTTPVDYDETCQHIPQWVYEAHACDEECGSIIIGDRRVCVACEEKNRIKKLRTEL